MGKKHKAAATPSEPQVPQVFAPDAPFVTQAYLWPIGPGMRITFAETTPQGQIARGAVYMGLDTLGQLAQLINKMLPPSPVPAPQDPPPQEPPPAAIDEDLVDEHGE